ncbi:hypothetical protein EDM59_30385 [Brevibacillus nitrificans]|uniref:AMP-binding enzyme C-terminal domain-containing protein n=1 Tax=Brevibacillus nitrificans TaxID=651560 RepID=A0A3M8CQV2_9BACL|nr:hypothetical protein EDM59_30385 [Brevibacillus nitrificans]
MIITDGENVYPVEIEQVLFRHPLVREVAVIGVPDVRDVVHGQECSARRSRISE